MALDDMGTSTDAGEIARYVPDATAPAAPRAVANLYILGGYHSGNAVPIEVDGAVLIGSADDDDVILSDPGLEPSHVKVRIQKTWRSFEIEAFGGPVELDDGRVLEPGEMASLALPGRIALVTGALNPIGLFVDVADVARDGRGRRTKKVATADSSAKASSKYRMPAILGAVAATALLIGVSVSAKVHFDGGESNEVSPLSKEVVQSSVFLPDVPDVAPIKVIATSVGALREKLASVGLTELTVSASQDFVSVKGALLPRDESAWKSVRRWYDREHASDFTLVADIAVQSERHPLPKRPSGIWLGADPYVVDADGKRRSVGAKTSDGWEILSIDRAGVRLRKDGQELTLSF